MARLRGFLSNSATSIPIDDTTTLNVLGGVVTIESEQVRYTTATDKAILGCTRGFNSTSAATHADKKLVTQTSTYPAVLSQGVWIASGDPTVLTGTTTVSQGDLYFDTDGLVFWQVSEVTADGPQWAQMGSGGSSTQVDNEVPTGDIDGMNDEFTLNDAPSPATSLHLYLNGIRLVSPADFSLTDDTITMETAPAVDSTLLADYRV